MENIDDFMRKKFDTDDPAGRFEFREEYWEQARALLEADEAKRRKRRRWLLWWWFAGIVATAGGAIFWRHTDSSIDRYQHQASLENSRKPDGQNQASAKQSPEHPIEPEDTFKRNNMQPGSIPANGPADNSKHKIDAKTTGNQPFILEKSEPALNVEGKKEIQSTASAIMPAALSADTGREKNVASPEIPATNAAGIFQSRQEAAALGDLPTADTLHEGLHSRFGVSPVIATLWLPLGLPARNPDASMTKPVSSLIKPVRSRLFHFGLAASASLYRPSPDKRRMGGTGAAFAAYQLRRDWSLSAGIQWRFLPGDWDPEPGPLGSEQVQYSFGVKTDEWSLKRRGLHFLELPVGLGWKRGNFNIEGGLAAAMLLGIQGELTHFHSESLQSGDHGKNNSRIWLDATDYRKFYVTGYLGAEWLALKRIGITIRGSYRPAGLLKPADTPDTGGQWWIDTGLRWHF